MKASDWSSFPLCWLYLFFQTCQVQILTLIHSFRNHQASSTQAIDFSFLRTRKILSLENSEDGLCYLCQVHSLSSWTFLQYHLIKKITIIHFPMQHSGHSHFIYLVACILCHLLLSIWKSGYSTLVDPEPRSQRRATLPRRISTARKSVWKTAGLILIHGIKCVVSVLCILTSDFEKVFPDSYVYIPYYRSWH